MSTEATFEYAVVRVVPRIERAEFLNVGVLVYSQSLDFLRAAVDVDVDRLLAVDPDADVDAITAAVDAFVSPCEIERDVEESGPPEPVTAESRFAADGEGEGREDEPGGDSGSPADECPAARESPAAQIRPGERFRWLTAPRSTVVQTGPVHAGLTDDPARELRRLLDRLVR